MQERSGMAFRSGATDRLCQVVAGGQVEGLAVIMKQSFISFTVVPFILQCTLTSPISFEVSYSIKLARIFNCV